MYIKEEVVLLAKDNGSAFSQSVTFVTNLITPFKPDMMLAVKVGGHDSSKNVFTSDHDSRIS